eukprot:CAMPEP_0179335588 /NCGR_PEP_ID=MMETSP0797-20121207/66577_1 /TAXON_ID=47934 /ORGANISM="Dinophysis acuminata, Strain DAEP01" /LENGTH=182 /DNA_ID=CAMNT_0021048993 /DNA_START=13 /DNA_END=557 /DNA_ORIENTATION=-
MKAAYGTAVEHRRKSLIMKGLMLAEKGHTGPQFAPRCNEEWLEAVVAILNSESVESAQAAMKRFISDPGANRSGDVLTDIGYSFVRLGDARGFERILSVNGAVQWDDKSEWNDLDTLLKARFAQVKQDLFSNARSRADGCAELQPVVVRGEQSLDALAKQRDPRFTLVRGRGGDALFEAFRL